MNELDLFAPEDDPCQSDQDDSASDGVRRHPPQLQKASRPHRRRGRSRTLFPYMGGKSGVARRIADLLPPHKRYVEAFCGGAAVFRAKSPSEHEVLNDLDPEIVNTLRAVRDHGEKIAETLQHAQRDRTLWEIFCAADPNELESDARACRHIYILQNSFCSGIRPRPHWSKCLNSMPRYDASRIAETVLWWQKRLANVVIEQLDFEDIIAGYDGPHTVFFIDSPYPDLEHYYKCTFSPSDHDRLARCLAGIKGRAIVTLPDTPAVRERYAFATSIVPLRFPYKVARVSRKQGQELLISIN